MISLNFRLFVVTDLLYHEFPRFTLIRVGVKLLCSVRQGRYLHMYV